MMAISSSPVPVWLNTVKRTSISKVVPWGPEGQIPASTDTSYRKRFAEQEPSVGGVYVVCGGCGCGADVATVMCALKFIPGGWTFSMVMCYASGAWV
jgi:hypothetical protein